MKKIIKNLGLLITILGISLLFQNKVEAAITGTDQGYTYSVEDGSDEATITGYIGGKTDITIPSELAGYQVTKIGVDAFNRNMAIVTVTIPGTVKTIEQFAFYSASNLKEVIIEDGSNAILCNSFGLCSNLEKMVIPASVTFFEYRDKGNEIFDGVNIKKLIVYLEPESAAQTYFDTYKNDIQYYYFDEFNPSSIEFSNPTLTINVGNEYTFSNEDFTVSPSTAYITTLGDYTTSDNYIAYIDNGVLKARNEGTVTINATISDKHLEKSVTTTVPLTVTVVESRKKVESISLNYPDVVRMYVGDTLQLEATVSPSDATYTGSWVNSGEEYYSEDKGIVNIDDNGIVTALAVGTGRVGYYTDSIFGNISDNNGKGIVLIVDEKPLPETPTTPEIPTTPTNPEIPTTPTTPETPTIPTNPEVPTTPQEPVKPVGYITLNASKINVQKGKTIKALALKVNQLEGDRIESVTSNNKKVLKASLQGQTIVLKGAKTYKKYVKVTVTMQSGATATCQVKVIGNSVNVKKLSLDAKKLTLKKGESHKIIVTKNPISATDKISYRSSNKKVATVDKNGKIKAKKKGKVTITVTASNGKKTTCKVTVK